MRAAALALALHLVLCVLLRAGDASLPASTGRNNIVSGDPAASVSIPLQPPLAPTTGVAPSLNPTDPSVQPLIIMSVDPSDLFTSFMVTSATNSVDGWLSAGPGEEAHYLFTAWGDASAVARLRGLISTRLQALGTKTTEAWRGRLHFTKGAADESLGSQLAGALRQWSTPQNRLSFTPAAVGMGGPSVNVSRLDCRYTWCSWPAQDQKYTVVPAGGGGACAPSNATSKGHMIFAALADMGDGSCTPEAAAAAAASAGAAGLVLAQAADRIAYPVGNGYTGSSSGVSIPVTMVTSAAGGQIAALLAGSKGAPVPAQMHSVAGPGQFIAVDRRGRLQEVGWEKYATLMMLRWAGDWLSYAADVDAHVREPAVVVPVFTGDPTLTRRRVTLPAAAAVAAFPFVELDFALTCAGSADQDCSVWDRIVSVSANCSKSEPAVEIGRWINPFQRNMGRWVTTTPLLAGYAGRTCDFVFHVDLNNPWRATLSIRYAMTPMGPRDPGAVVPAPPPPLPVQLLPSPRQLTPVVFPNMDTSFTSPAYNENRTMSFHVPDGTQRVGVAALITGHGGCEFVATSHHFAVNGHHGHNTSEAPFADRFMQAGTDLGCAAKTRRGAVPNEHGTWYFGRDGWCDGQDVKPVAWDVTADVELRGLNTLTYHALAYEDPAGPGSDKGCSGYIQFTAALVFW